MKKLILVFVAVAITAGAYAQVDSTHRKMSQQDMKNHQNHNLQNNPVDKYPDGVMMHNGKMMKVKNGQITSLQDDDMIMSNGTRITSDGTCINKDGTKMMMKDGQRMDMSGNMIHNSNVQNTHFDRSNTDGVTMQNGKMMKVKNGQMTVLQDNDVIMTNGTRIMSDGSFTNKDGIRMIMREGQYMDMSGNMIRESTIKDRNMYLVPDSTIKR